MANTLEDDYKKLVREIENCKKCPLYKYRKNPVPGEGPLDAKIMFVGEAPGKTEDETGRPFVGRAGELLTLLMKNAGIDRRKVYITNIVKCRPPGNRDPSDEEIEACTPYLWRQIRLIKPRVIVTLGRHAGRVLFRKAGLEWKTITKHHGRVYEAVVEGVRVKIIPTYHPAAALYRKPLRQSLEEDFQKAISSVVKNIETEGEKKPSKQRSLLDFLVDLDSRGSV